MPPLANAEASNPRHPVAPPADVAQPAPVSVRNLTKSYGSVVAVDGLTFELMQGTVTGFLGPNGAGKSSTLRMLLGLAETTSGEALVFGRPYRQLQDPARRVGALLESGDFDPGRSGRNHLRALALAGHISVDRVEEVLDLVGLQGAADRHVKGYSLGMRQRLGLAGALLGDPELLLLDEPANGLDPEGVHWLRGFLRNFAAEGRTVLISSHVLPEMAQIADSVVIMHRGRLVAQLGPDELEQGDRSLEERYLLATTGGAQ
jgi:ABC-2 type transport system ATP-binding protein